MVDREFTIRDDFPPVHYDQWRELAEASLKGASFEKKLVTHTYEGIDLQPIYTSAERLGEGDPTGLPGKSPFVRGSTPLGATLTGWDLRQEHALPEPAATNKAILADLEGGVTSLLLVFDRAACAGFDPDDARAADLVGLEGLMAFHVDDLDTALADVPLSRVGVTVEPGAAFLPAAALLVALWKRRHLAPSDVRGAFNADPLAALAREGRLPMALETALAQMADLAAWTSKNYSRVTAISVDTSPYHHAGATAAQDLACAMATAVEYLRTMTGSGIKIDDAARQILFRISLGTHHFLSIAKLRAGRRMWARVIEASGGSPESAMMQVHARLSNRVQTRHDPYVNLLRNTVGVFAAGIGGAAAITSIPFDYATGQTDYFSRRVARNTGLVLQEEAQLHRVIDPAGGSWFLEKLTDQVAEKAWEVFQEIERRGGMIQVLQSGWLARQIDSAFAPRAKDIASRKEGITGVSEFPNLEQQRIAHKLPDPQQLRGDATQSIKALRKEPDSLASLGSAKDRTAAAVQSASDGATLGQLALALGFHAQATSVTPLEARSFAQPYEELRDACDAWQETQGRRPSVFLANMGPIAHHTARATYSKSFFEAGGFEVISNEGFQDANAAAQALAKSGASIAVICSSDKLYPEVVPEVAPLLKAAGARTVVLAGKPGTNEEAWRAAGVDRFIFISCNVLGTLREMLQEEGVLTS
ncbi:MAG: methylmalonyl-CoA mutase subunit beta [Pirellulales bacterium]|nr:methylmalonyl-CoA mutase subunit beta [Pirellulales bacterium]